MAIIKPFRALRPVREKAEQVSCVPYDVINPAELHALIEDNPLSFLRVTRPEAELDVAAETEETLALARRNLQKLIDENVFMQEDEPALYVYRLTDGKRQTQTGVVACCSLDEYEKGLIKKHEKTREDKVQDRTEHILALRAQTGLIFFTFRASDAISELIAKTVTAEPIYDFGCPQQISNTIWKVSAAATADFVSAFAEVPTLYVADGHHRLEAARRARYILQAENPNHTGAEDYNFVMAGIFPAEDLQILPYNRVVRDLNGLSVEEFLERLKENFVITDAEKPTPENRNEFCMYLGEGKWRRLIFSVAFVRAPDPVDALDVSILQNYILKNILGIEDIRTDKRVDFVGGIRGTEELERLVDTGEFKIAFSLFPTTVEDLFLVSDADEIMPPKSTWFEPKLRDGLLIHLI